MTADPTEDAEYFAGLWDQFKDIVLERMTAVEEAAAAVQGGNLGEALRTRAELAAHKLAGSLGSIGFPDGSRIAQQLEEMLRGNPSLDPSRFSDLTTALRHVLEQGPA